MSSDSIEVREQYLLDYLHDEFRTDERVWIRFRTENDVRGILVRLSSRAYFFPLEWSHTSEGFQEVRALVVKIKSLHD